MKWMFEMGVQFSDSARRTCALTAVLPVDLGVEYKEQKNKRNGSAHFR